MGNDTRIANTLRRRYAISLLEVIIAICIIAVLIGMILPAVWKAKFLAHRCQTSNELRQIATATHNYSNSNAGAIPGYGILIPGVQDFGKVATFGPGLFLPILPYSDYGNSGSYKANAPFYTSALDQTLAHAKSLDDDATSFAANHQVFRAGSNLMQSYPDGLSCTIAILERYSSCNGINSTWRTTSVQCGDFDGNLVVCSKSNRIVKRRPTFADPEYDDVLPISENGITRPSLSGFTFQIESQNAACDYRTTQTLSGNCMIAAYLDGSVRFIGPEITPTIFWAEVTPSGGEVSVDW